MHKVAVAGASGRMGHMLIEAIRASSDCQLAGALDVAASPAIGNDATAFLGHASGVPITADLRAGLSGAEVLIDFTRPEGTLAHLRVCRELGVNAVIGTTGFSEEQKAEIADCARDIAIVMAPNMSVGVNVTLKLLEMAAKALSTGYDIEIIEAHHRHKVDAPSGTALKMGEVIAAGAGPRPQGLRRLRPRGRDRRARSVAPSALPPSAAATSWATTRCCSPAPASASRSRTSPSSRATYAQGSLRAVRFLAGKHERPVRHVRRARAELGACSEAVRTLAVQPGRRGHRQVAAAAAGHVGGQLGGHPLEGAGCCAAPARDVARSTAAFWQSPALDDGRASRSPPSTARRWCCR